MAYAGHATFRGHTIFTDERDLMVKVHVIFETESRGKVSALLYLNEEKDPYTCASAPSGAEVIGKLLMETSLYEEHTGKPGPGSIDLLCLPFILTTAWSHDV